MNNIAHFAIVYLTCSTPTLAQEWFRGPTKYEYLVLSEKPISLTQGEAESGCHDQNDSLPSFSSWADLKFLVRNLDTIRLSRYWTSGKPKVLSDKIAQVWPDNTPINAHEYEGSCRALPLNCAIIYNVRTFYSVLREYKREVSHLCQRLVMTGDREIAGINGMDYLLIDSSMNYTDALAACQSNNSSLPSLHDEAALRFLTAMINYGHTYWTSAELSEDGISYQWADYVGIAIHETSGKCPDYSQECFLASDTGRLIILPEHQLTSIVVCARYRNIFKYHGQEIPFIINDMSTNMAKEAIFVSRNARIGVTDVEEQVQLVSQHFDNKYGRKWNCSIQNVHMAELRTRTRKTRRNFIQFIIDGVVVTLYQSLPRV